MFCNKKILFFDSLTQTLKEDKNLLAILNKPQKTVQACFINFQDIQIGIPVGTPTFIKNGNILPDLKEGEVKGPRRIEDGFINNVENNLVKKTVSKFRVVDSGMYRVFVFGGGMNNSGCGALLFSMIFI